MHSNVHRRWWVLSLPGASPPPKRTPWPAGKSGRGATRLPCVLIARPIRGKLQGTGEVENGEYRAHNALKTSPFSWYTIHHSPFSTPLVECVRTEEDATGCQHASRMHPDTHKASTRCHACVRPSFSCLRGRREWSVQSSALSRAHRSVECRLAVTSIELSHKPDSSSSST